METKFTKGPWIIKNHNGDSIYIGRYHDFSIMSGDSEVICLEPSVIKDGEDVNANAHLIAAAPDLYELLNRVLIDNQMGGYTTTDTLNSIELALAKARGEQP